MKLNKLFIQFKIKLPLQVAVLASLLLSVLFVTPTKVWAEDIPVTLGVSPAVSEIKIDAGSKQSREIIVTNNGDLPIALRVYAENFEAADMYGAIKFNTDDNTQYSSRNWLIFENPSMVIAPKETSKMNFVIDCPKEAESGGHYSSIFFEPVRPYENSQNSNIGISQRVGALLFITVNGANTEKGEVLGASTMDKCAGIQCSFKTDSFREWGPVSFSFQFKNTGDIHTKVGGKIDIYNIFGNKVGELLVNEKTVLPGTTRLFEAKWLREPLFGRYTAKLTINYGENTTKTEHATASFWALPWRLMLVVLIPTFIIVLFCLHKRKKNHKKKLDS